MPRRRRSARSGRLTSTQTMPRPANQRASPAPSRPVPSIPTRSTTAEVFWLFLGLVVVAASALPVSAATVEAVSARMENRILVAVDM